MRLRGVFVAALAAFVVLGSSHVVRASEPAPGAARFSREGLTRVGDYIRNEIATGTIPGAILLIQQHGKPVYFESFGVRNPATGQPMTPDTLFQI